MPFGRAVTSVCCHRHLLGKVATILAITRYAAERDRASSYRPEPEELAANGAEQPTWPAKNGFVERKARRGALAL